MKRHLRKINRVFLVALLLCFGCVSVERVSFDPTWSVEDIQKAWKRNPNKIVRDSDKLKYDADELWIYEYGKSGSFDYYYFKNGNVAMKEHVVHGTL